jgi:hypothetical protein
VDSQSVGQLQESAKRTGETIDSHQRTLRITSDRLTGDIVRAGSCRRFAVQRSQHFHSREWGFQVIASDSKSARQIEAQQRRELMTCGIYQRDRYDIGARGNESIGVYDDGVKITVDENGRVSQFAKCAILDRKILILACRSTPYARRWNN